MSTKKLAPSAKKGHFPKKGERKVNGVWKPAKDKATPVGKPPAPSLKRGPALSGGKRTTTAADRRNWLNKKAGWPVRGTS